MRIFQKILALCCSVMSLFLLSVVLYRLSWDYNENGVHFEKESITTYTEGAILAYSMLAFVFLVPAVFLWKNLASKREDT